MENDTAPTMVGLTLLVTGLVLGVLLIWTVKVRSAREQAKGVPDDASKRWTAAEVLAVLGAVTTLISGAATAYNAIQGGRAQLSDSVSNLLTFKVGTWERLPVVSADTGTLPFQTDDRRVKGKCSKEKGGFVYDGTGPAVLECDSSDITLTLRVVGGSRILLTPLLKQGPVQVHSTGASAGVRSDSNTAKPSNSPDGTRPPQPRS